MKNSYIITIICMYMYTYICRALITTEIRIVVFCEQGKDVIRKRHMGL